MATAKQFNDKVVVSDKLAANMVKAKIVAPEELAKVIVSDDVPVDGSVAFDHVASDVASSDQPLLMAKADIDAVVSESAGSAVVSDADVTYTDHISSDVAEVATEQPELVAMNTVQHLTESTVLAGEEVVAAGGFPWAWAGAAAVVGGGLGLAAGSNSAKDTPVTPEEPTVHVVVERAGAFIDTDNDGVKDDSESYLSASTGLVTGDAGLADHHVVVHFNDVTEDALNLTGFGADDKLEFDIITIFNNATNGSGNHGDILFCETKPLSRLTIASDHVNYGFTADVNFIVNQHTGSFQDYNHATHTGQYALLVDGDGTINGIGGYSNHDLAAIAYWSDAGNALNDAHQLFPNYDGSNTGTVLANISNGTEVGLVEFVYPHPIAVVVDADGAFIDTNMDGIHDAGETTAAVFSSGGSADLAASMVTIHVHDVPTAGALSLDGFGSDDMIEIDMNAFYFGNPAIARNSQTKVSSNCNHHSTPASRSSIIADNSWMNASPATNVHAFVNITESSAMKIGICKTNSSKHSYGYNTVSGAWIKTGSYTKFSFSATVGTPEVLATFGSYSPEIHQVEFVAAYT